MTLTLPDLNSHLSCRLCSGYLINATTIVECFHSFCKSCLIKQLELVANKCPVCKIAINKEESFSSLRCDSVLQRLIYKLVPNLFARENERRQAFYKEHLEDKIHNELDRFKKENIFYDLKDLIDISIEYLPKCQTSQHPMALPDDWPSIQSSAKRRFLRVECCMKIAHLKKWIKLKFGLPHNQRVVLLVDSEILPDSYQMIDLAYIFSQTKRPLNLYYYYCKIPVKKTVLKRKPEMNGKEESGGKKMKPNGKLGSAFKEAANGKPVNGDASPFRQATSNDRTTPNVKKSLNGVGSNGTTTKLNGAASTNTSSGSSPSKPAKTSDKPNRASPNRTDRTKPNGSSTETKAKPNGSDRPANSQTNSTISKIKKVSNGLASDTNSRNSNSKKTLNGRPQPNGKQSNDLDSGKANRKRLVEESTKSNKRQQVGAKV